ncbi:MAG: hypothetical protein K0S76_1919 [Herbinix sp.]|jgi:hypothetical protein|nr:hypothetical protein [Herbinix sp.]
MYLILSIAMTFIIINTVVLYFKHICIQASRLARRLCISAVHKLVLLYIGIIRNYTKQDTFN